MSIKISPTKVLDYSNNIVYPEKAKQLYSFSIARSICHLAAQIDRLIHRFYCRICQILLTTLLSRGQQKLLKIVKKNNYMYITDDFIIITT